MLKEIRKKRTAQVVVIQSVADLPNSKLNSPLVPRVAPAPAATVRTGEASSSGVFNAPTNVALPFIRPDRSPAICPVPGFVDGGTPPVPNAPHPSSSDEISMDSRPHKRTRVCENPVGHQLLNAQDTVPRPGKKVVPGDEITTAMTNMIIPSNEARFPTLSSPARVTGIPDSQAIQTSSRLQPGSKLLGTDVASVRTKPRFAFATTLIRGGTKGDYCIIYFSNPPSISVFFDTLWDVHGCPMMAISAMRVVIHGYGIKVDIEPEKMVQDWGECMELLHKAGDKVEAVISPRW